MKTRFSEQHQYFKFKIGILFKNTFRKRDLQHSLRKELKHVLDNVVSHFDFFLIKYILEHYLNTGEKKTIDKYKVLFMIQYSFVLR